MPGLDFSRLTGPSAADSQLHPRDIFAALPRTNSPFEYLRDVQREVLDEWFLRRDEPDLTIKMNTGNGKTVVGLLALKSSLNEGKGPCSYFTADKFLAEQVTESARLLGIRVTDDPRDPTAIAGESILVTNIFVLFNGKSKFGLSSQGSKLKLGTILVDDAHACATIVQDQFEIRIPRDAKPYTQLLKLLRPNLESQHPAKLLDLEAGDRSPALQIPPWVWYDQRSRILKILHESRDDEFMVWGWPLIREVLPVCRAVFTADELQIAPIVPPVLQVPTYIQATRRIYLTATLADDSLLVSHFDADTLSTRKPITPGAADDIGDRMILIPQRIQPNWSDEAIKQYLCDLSKRLNVAVIVPSHSRASWWSDVATFVVDASNIENQVGQLKAAHRGLVVLVNKYDGIDLPDDACRVLVVDGLPEVSSGLDRVEREALGNNEGFARRQMQRVEQGMGRGIRSRDDYCVVIILGRQLVARLHDPSVSESFSPATYRQLGLSKQMSEQLSVGTFDDLKAAVDQFLDRDDGWVTASRNALVGAKYGPGRVRESVPLVRKAFDLATQDRFQEAVTCQREAARLANSALERGWFKQQETAYLHPVNAVEAQNCQRMALDDNCRLLRSDRRMTFDRPIRPSQRQAEGSSTFLRSQYSSANDMLIGVHAMLSALEFSNDPNLVDEFEQAFADLGSHLGFGARRPDRDLKEGPDILWDVGGDQVWVIEAKSGAVAEFISKNDINQLAGSVNWAKNQFSADTNVRPVLIHQSSRLHREATSPRGTLVISRTLLPKLTGAVHSWTMALVLDEGFADSNKVKQQLDHFQLNGAQLINSFGITPHH